MAKPKYAPPKSSDEKIAELENMIPITDDDIAELDTLAEARAASIAEFEVFEAATAPETISLTDLLLLGIEPRFERLTAALENVVKIKTAGANNIEALTVQVNRLADALDSIAATLGCITESVKSDEDGVTRCYVRTRDDNHDWFLASRDERED
jgi:hypothetical protein